MQPEILLAFFDSFEKSSKKSDFTTASGRHQLCCVPNFIIFNAHLLFLLILAFKLPLMQSVNEAKK